MPGSLYARGVNKVVTMAEETVTFGVAGTSVGQLLRRTAANLNLNASSIESQEIIASQQVRDMRLGPRQVSGTISGELSPTSYKMFFEGLFRWRWMAGQGSVAAITDSSIGADSGTPPYQVGTTPWEMIDLASQTVNYALVGLRIGDVVRVSGLTGNISEYNNSNVQIVGFNVGANVAVLNGGLPAWNSTTINPQTAVSVYVPGFKLIMPANNQQLLSYTFEEWYSDIARSQVFTGCRVTQISLTIPASGFVTFSASVTGQNMVTSGNQLYTVPLPVDTDTSLTATGGQISYNGVPLGYITSMSLQIQADMQADPVVGSEIVPDIFQGTNSVRGSLTCFMANDILQANFLNEVEVQIVITMTTSPNPNSGEFISINLPRVKLASSTKTDSDKAISRSFNFMALERCDGNGWYDQTTIAVIDSTSY